MRLAQIRVVVRELESVPDLVELAASARDAGQEVVLIERPMPEAVSVAALGRAFEIVSTRGGACLEDVEGRVLDAEEDAEPIRAAAAIWRRFILGQGLAGDGVPGFPGAGPIAVGGFAFDPRAEPSASWAGFPGLLLRVPALAVVRVRGRTFASSVVPDGADLLQGQSAAAFSARAARSLSVASVRSPAGWKDAVRSATRRLSAGEADKVVLARELQVEADGVLAAARVARSLRAAHPSCFTYAVSGSDGSALVGASPELLLRRRGRLATSQPMAGSIGRGDDEAEDEALARELAASAKNRAEHALVPDQVVAALAPVSAWVRTADPEVVRFTNIQHLATTVTAELMGEPPPSALELAGLLHPTPAVGGHPRAAALGMIRELELMERGWYAGAVGWVDGRGDGEFAVALRCGLLEDSGARLYAGSGIMADSDPEHELAETELKFKALLGALTG